MGFMDKVKAQATVLADKAQTGVQQGQSKLAEMQSNKQADHLLRELGAFVFLSERGRNQPDSEARVAALMDQLDAIEAGGTPITLTPDQSQLPSANAVPQAGTIPADGSVPQTAPAPPLPTAAPPPPVPTAGGGLPPTGDVIPQSGGGLPGQ
jgi:hypothetical protein